MKKLINLSGVAMAAAVVVCVIAGCVTQSTVQTRSQERKAVYDSLSPAFRDAVDHGRILAGMNEDAVYIAWGRPGQVVRGGNEAGETTTWYYTATQLEDAGYWGFGHYHPVYYNRTYYAAGVLFVNGLVRSWQTYPHP